jgi:hypothetical protein
MNIEFIKRVYFYSPKTNSQSLQADNILLFFHHFTWDNSEVSFNPGLILIE